GEPTVDGRWQALPAETAPYATRIVVVRPADPKRFNGTVAVEWLNVTAGLDAAPDWSYLHRELMRGGYAYVGVSAQRVGVEGGSRFGSGGALKSANPARYGALSHPGDAYAFDMFTQVGRVVDSRQVLGGLKAARVLAMGESQSASYLTTYVNAVDRLARVYDGFLIHSRSGGAALLSPPPPTAAAGPGGPPGGPRAPIG
ncbi:MAG: alpha/beta hydrolase domain-containing protein, partial [Phenylobacterium sp.]